MAGKSEPLLRRLICTALLLVAGLSAAAAEPVRGQSRELGIQFELAGDADWCDATVVVQLGAERAAVYQAESLPFLRMIGRIRAIINDQCPKVERVLFIGFERDRKVFAAEMNRLTRWRRIIGLDPESELPACTPTGPNDIECDRRVAAYATVIGLMTGPAFADVELTSMMEDRTDLQVAWEERGAFGALQLSHRTEHDGRYADHVAFADANADGAAEACTEDGGQATRMPAKTFGAAIAYRGVMCRRRGHPARANLILVRLQDDWFYLFSIWAEDPHVAAADAMASRIGEALAGAR